MKQPPIARGGIYHVKDNFELGAKIVTLNRRLEEMEGKGHQGVNTIQKFEINPTPCTHFYS